MINFVKIVFLDPILDYQRTYFVNKTNYFLLKLTKNTIM